MKAAFNTYKLEDVLDVLIDYRGKSPKKSVTGIPVLSAKVVKTTGLIEPIEQTISPEYYSVWMTRGLPRIGDVLFTTEGPMGEVLQLDKKTASYALGQRIVCLRGKPELLDNTFLRYLLTSPIQQHILSSYATGTTVMGISQKALRSVPVELPDTTYQKKIANVLVTLDDKIELNRQTNATLEAIAQAVFKDWFVDFGPTLRKSQGDTDPVKILGGLIPDPAKAAKIAALFPDSFNDEVLPQGWKQGVLSDIAKESKERAKPEIINPQTPYIGLEHMPRNSISLGEWETAEKISSTKSVFTKGQILFGKLRPYFHKIGLAPIDGICSTDIVVLDGKRETDRSLICSLCSSKVFVDYNTKASSGTRMPRTKWSIMGAYPMAIAPEIIRDAYSEIVSLLHNKILQAIEENQTLAETRDYLLPKLMSGEVRVGDAAAETPTKASNVVPMGGDLFDRKALPADKDLERDSAIVAGVISALQKDTEVVGNVKYQKGCYFVYRRMGYSTRDFERKAAGPYSRKIVDGGYARAVSQKFIRYKDDRKYPGNVPARNISAANELATLYKLGDALAWVKQHLSGKNRGELELWATVDYAMIALRNRRTTPTADTVIDYIRNEPEWAAKLKKASFTKSKIGAAIVELDRAFAHG